MFQQQKPATEAPSADRAQVPPDSQQPAIHVFFVGLQWCLIEINGSATVRSGE